MNATTLNARNNKPVLVGAAVGFLVFLVVGAIPALLYGGYLGLMMANALFGSTGDLSLAARMMTGGGMLLGFFAVNGLFLVAGGVLGTVFGAGMAKVSVQQSHGEPVPAVVK